MHLVDRFVDLVLRPRKTYIIGFFGIVKILIFLISKYIKHFVYVPDSKCDLGPEADVDNGANADHIADVSRTSRANKAKLVECQNCGIQHPMQKCPAFGKAYFNYGKLNHHAEFCKKTTQATLNSLLALLKKSSPVLCNTNTPKPSLINVTINGVHLNGLLDTGVSECFMKTRLAERLGLKINKFFDGKVPLAYKELKSNVMGNFVLIWF